MIQAQYYNFVRLGFSGYKGIVENMLKNAKHLNSGSRRPDAEVLNPACSEPVVTFV